MRGKILVLAAAVLWGTTGSAQALAPSEASSLGIGAARLAVAGLALLAIAWRNGALRGVRRFPALVVFAAALAIAAYQLTFFAGVRRAGVAVGTMIAIGSAPVWAGLLAAVFERAWPGRRWLAATALAVAGCVLLLSPTGEVRLDAPGVLLALAAGLAYAAYTLVNKRLLNTLSPDAAVAAVFSLAALLLLPLWLTQDMRWLLQARGVLVALHLGLIATALSYRLFTRGLALTPPAEAVSLSLAEPLTAALLGLFLLGERLTPAAVAGMLLILAGLAWLALARE